MWFLQPRPTEHVLKKRRSTPFGSFVAHHVWLEGHGGFQIFQRARMAGPSFTLPAEMEVAVRFPGQSPFAL